MYIWMVCQTNIYCFHSSLWIKIMVPWWLQLCVGVVGGCGGVWEGVGVCVGCVSVWEGVHASFSLKALYWIIIVVDSFHINLALSYIYHNCTTIGAAIWWFIWLVYLLFPCDIKSCIQDSTKQMTPESCGSRLTHSLYSQDIQRGPPLGKCQKMAWRFALFLL